MRTPSLWVTNTHFHGTFKMSETSSGNGCLEADQGLAGVW
jgi:hypothetical protein